ncbi:MAG: TolC family protein, partial [Mariprofundaceae bacterium]|nr:TolC family protein [Mariprofundaceae bacterium]
MKRILLFVLALSVFPLQSIAMGLTDAARLALDYAPSYAAAEAARDAAGEDMIIGRAGLLPFITGTGEFSHFKQKYNYTRNPGFLASNVVFNRSQFGGTLVQPLFRLDRWAGFAQGKLASEIGELKLSLERQVLLLAVAGAYVDVLVAREDMAAIKTQEEAVSHLREQASAAFDVGTATVNDALEAESRLDLVRADRIQVENALDTARESFESLTGAKTENLFLFAQDASLESPEPKQRDYWRNAGMHQALSGLLAEKKMEVAKQEVSKSFGLALPGVDLVAGLSREKVTNNLFDTGSTVKTEQLG